MMKTEGVLAGVEESTGESRRRNGKDFVSGRAFSRAAEKCINVGL
jgi:hypothetical protein